MSNHLHNFFFLCCLQENPHKSLKKLKRRCKFWPLGNSSASLACSPFLSSRHMVSQFSMCSLHSSRSFPHCAFCWEGLIPTHYSPLPQKTFWTVEIVTVFLLLTMITVHNYIFIYKVMHSLSIPLYRTSMRQGHTIYWFKNMDSGVRDQVQM